MKVKVSALVTYITDLDVSFYEEIDDGPRSEAEILEYELRQIADGNSDNWIEALAECGDWSNLKFEPVVEGEINRTDDSPSTPDA